MTCGKLPYVSRVLTLAVGTVLAPTALAVRPDAPRLTLGVVSDIHLRCPETGFDEHGVDVVDFRKALRAFRAAGVDGVVISGDLASGGRRCDLESVSRIWYETFPGDRLPDGRKVEKLFVTGNHDYSGPGESAGAWEACFHEPFEPVWMKTVKGYTFIGAHWICAKESKAGMCFNDRIEPFFAAHGKGLEGTRPFFFILHPHPKDTCYGPGAWGHEDGTATRLLSAYPNAVALSGHSHYSLADDQSVWQGAFTSIGCGSLACTERPLPCSELGDENGNTPKGDAKCKLLPPHVQYRNVQGLILRVYDDRLVIERRRFDEAAKIGPDWIVPIPAGTSDFQDRRQLSVPRFAASARVTVETGDGLDRGGNPCRLVTAVFPQATEGPRALRYDVALQAEDGRELARKTVIEDGFHRAPDPLRMNRCPFDREMLPRAGGWRFMVYPRNAWGRMGDPLFSELQR